MKKLSAAEVKELLLQNEAENAEHIDEVNWHVRCGVDAEYCLLDGVVVFAVSFRGEDSTTLIPAADEFDIMTACRWAVENRKNASIGIDTSRLNETQRAAVSELLADTHTPGRTARRYLRTDRTIPETDERISHLTTADKDAFVNMEFTKEPNRPTQEILFNHFLVEQREEGGILVYRENETILGYLAYYRVSGDYYESDYIWVAPSKRRQGIGKKLTDAFIAVILQSGGIPMWSNPVNDISAHLAETHGFAVIRETMRFQVK